jgi:hypothetical protein
MAERGRSLRELALAAIGAMAVGTERAEELVSDLASGGGFDPEAIFRELGLATRTQLEELDLRLAQVEHRLRLLETAPQTPAAPPPVPRLPAA